MADGDFGAELQAWLQGVTPPAGLRNFGATPTADDVAPARAWQKMLADGGFACLSWPVEHGGRAAPIADQAAFAEALARADLPRQAHIVGPDLVGPMLLAHGSDEQKAAYLEPIRTGEHIWCQLFSEPEAGSDLASVRTRAVPDGDGFRISGQKVWTSGANSADMGLLLARTGDGRMDLTMFMIPMRDPAISVRPLRQMDGETKFNEVFLDGVVAPASAVLGAVGNGWKVAMGTLGNERLALAGQAVSMFALFETIVEQARKHGTVDDVFRERAAKVWSRIWLLRATWRRAVQTAADGADPAFSVLKLSSSELLRDLTYLGADAEGPYLAAGDSETLRGALLAAPGQTIAGGSSNIQRNILAERILGLPR